MDFALERQSGACDELQTGPPLRHICVAIKRFRAAGIGFVFTDVDPSCGIDLDKYREKNGRVNEEASRFIHRMGSYLRCGCSGDGVGIIIKAQFGTAGQRTTDIEGYASGRYFTTKGNHLAARPSTLKSCSTSWTHCFKSAFHRTRNRPNRKQLRGSVYPIPC